MECGFCQISKEECPERVESGPDEGLATTDFWEGPGPDLVPASDVPPWRRFERLHVGKRPNL